MKKKTLIKYTDFAIVMVLLYLGNVELQTFLGEKAVNSTGLHSVTFNDALIQSVKPIL